MALSYNLDYQESISVHPTRRQIFAGKPYSTFPNIREWVISYSSFPGNAQFEMGEQFQLKHNKYCTNLWCKCNIILGNCSYDDNNSFVSCCPLTIPLMVRPPWWILCWCWWRCSWYVPQTTIKSYATDINNSNRGARPLFLGLAQNGSRRG